MIQTLPKNERAEIVDHLVAGIGCRKGTPAATILNVLAATMMRIGHAGQWPGMLATGGIKADEPGLIAAAETLGLALVVVDQDELNAAAPRTLTVSDVSLAHTGSPSLCEAAALVAAGSEAALAAPRYVRDGVTCAIATTKTDTERLTP